MDATERKVLIGCGAVAGMLCSAPGDVVPAIIIWVPTLALLLVHYLLIRKERRAEPASPLVDAATLSGAALIEAAPTEGGPSDGGSSDGGLSDGGPSDGGSSEGGSSEGDGSP